MTWYVWRVKLNLMSTFRDVSDCLNHSKDFCIYVFFPRDERRFAPSLWLSQSLLASGFLWLSALAPDYSDLSTAEVISHSWCIHTEWSGYELRPYPSVCSHVPASLSRVRILLWPHNPINYQRSSVPLWFTFRAGMYALVSVRTNANLTPCNTVICNTEPRCFCNRQIAHH